MPYGTYSQKGEFMPRHSYCRQTKLSDISGRIDYITNPDRQEHFYAMYDTATPEFWKQLKEENHKEYNRYGCSGMVVEGREWIIALEESLTKEEPEIILKTFTNAFSEKYGVDCIAALHHNKSESNYHIHLIYSERQRLAEPIEKIATRNMFFDEQGHRKRTKKEILNPDGSIRLGCNIISKGDIYETSYLSGKNNPKEAYIQADNKARKDWNLKADEALVCGVTEENVMEIKRQHINEPVKQSILNNGKKHGLLQGIIRKAINMLSESIQSIHQVKEPVLLVNLEEFEEMKTVKRELDQNQQRIDKLTKQLDELQKEISTLYAPWKKNKNLKEQATTFNRIQDLQREHGAIVKDKGYRNVQSFMKAYRQSVAAIKQYQHEMKAYWKQNSKEIPDNEKSSIHDKLNQYKKQAKQLNMKDKAIKGDMRPHQLF